ncbi:hypothetical protein HAX54_036571 [Datura stramonium]|uniref:Uncharacterized protein n=1 Tax=Datura stramonium TaxID=4076 RepID=A0ABS8VJT2_DATST|nr:hypothetical protein [Datura stramonium]
MVTPASGILQPLPLVQLSQWLNGSGAKLQQASTKGISYKKGGVIRKTTQWVPKRTEKPANMDSREEAEIHIMQVIEPEYVESIGTTNIPPHMPEPRGGSNGNNEGPK